MDKGKLLDGACSHQKHKSASWRETDKKKETEEKNGSPDLKWIR